MSYQLALETVGLGSVIASPLIMLLAGMAARSAWVHQARMAAVVVVVAALPFTLVFGFVGLQAITA